MVKVVLRLLALAVTVTGFWWLYQQGQKPSEARPFAPYQLAALAETPLPRAVFLNGLRFFASAFCKDKQYRKLLATDEAGCLATVERQHNGCLNAVQSTVPATLNQLDEVNRLSARYIECATGAASATPGPATP